MYKAGGRHVHIDLWYNEYTSNDDMRLMLTIACANAKATVVDTSTFDFDEGFTQVLLLTESHASIHTWPEHKYVAIDFFFCGSADIDVATRTVLFMFDIKKVNINKYLRGDFSDESQDRKLPQG